MSTPYETHQEAWAGLVRDLGNNPSATTAKNLSRDYLARSLDLLHGAKTVETRRVIFTEGSRIATRAVRRHHALISAADAVLPEAVVDQTRALVEMLFQAFYLLRHADPYQASLDAVNFSAMSWARKSDKLVAQGYLQQGPPRDATDPRSLMETEVLSKYVGRKPKFYADLRVLDVAEGAGLTRVYDMIYSALSQETHNEPWVDLGSSRHKPEKNRVELQVFPSDKTATDMFGTFSVGTQAAFLTVLAGLALVCSVDQVKAAESLTKFSNIHTDWDAELKTLADKWSVTIPPRTRDSGAAGTS